MYGSMLDKDIENYKDNSYVRVSVPFGWFQSNAMIGLFAHASDIDRRLALLSRDHHLVSPNEGSSDYWLRAKYRPR